MGLLFIIPIIIILRSTIILIKNSDNLMYVGLFFIINNIFSGGMFYTYKSAFFTFFIIWILVMNVKKYRKK